MAKQIFRKVALDRLKSPEQLDQLLQITKPTVWLALIAFCLLCIWIIIWGFTGSIETTVNGQGIVMMEKNGAFTIVANSNGQIQEVRVQVGDIVKPGQIVVLVSRPLLILQTKSTQKDLKRLESKYNKIAKYETTNIQMNRKLISKERLRIKLAINDLKYQKKVLNKRLINKKKVLKEGLSAQQHYFDTKVKLDNVLQQIRVNNNKLKQLSIKTFQNKENIKKQLLDLNDQIQQAKVKLNGLDSELSDSSFLFSPYYGSVLSINKSVGAFVERGTALIVLELLGQDEGNLDAMCYFSAKGGQKIKNGMQIMISPVTTKKENFGSMIGIVTYVSPFPVNSASINRVLQNEIMVNKIVKNGAPIFVSAVMVPDPNATSGYKWTSSKGPDFAIHAGTECKAYAIVKKQRPVDLVIPFVKTLVSGD